MSAFKRHSVYISAFVLLLGFIGTQTIARRGVPVVVETNLEKLPFNIGGYSATEVFFEESVYLELNADKYVSRQYRLPEGHYVDLYIGYYGTAKGGRTPHNPYSCLPASGWAIIQTARIQLNPSFLDHPVTVNQIHGKKGNLIESVVHWYQSSGTQVIDTGIARNIYRFKGRLLYNRNDGAFVRLSAIGDQSQLQDTDGRVKAFAEQVLELLPRYWPEEE